MEPATYTRAVTAPRPVRLRPVEVSDLAMLEQMLVDEETIGSMNWAGFSDRGIVRRRFEENGFLGPDSGRLIVERDGAVAGEVSWHTVHHGPRGLSRCWNIGIALLPNWRGKGLGAPAQRALAVYLFSHSTAARVEASTRADNIPEQRALEKAGFTREGVMRQAQFSHGAWHDMVLYSLVRGDLRAEVPAAPA
jgi:[ribosomal protein S5]-alanine N-acetyltransferase